MNERMNEKPIARIKKLHARICIMMMMMMMMMKKTMMMTMVIIG